MVRANEPAVNELWFGGWGGGLSRPGGTSGAEEPEGFASFLIVVDLVASVMLGASEGRGRRGRGGEVQARRRLRPCPTNPPRLRIVAAVD